MARNRSARFDTPTLDELVLAHSLFEEREPRDLFYRIATWLMDPATRVSHPFGRTDALAALLQTWNRGYYQRQRIPFDAAHYAAIDGLLERHDGQLAAFGARTIASLRADDEPAVRSLFAHFTRVLGPTGASKALHLLAPRFFPLWDSEIAARGYHLYQRDDIDYWLLLEAVRDQSAAVGGEQGLGGNPVKAVDEYNYCRYTLNEAALRS